MSSANPKTPERLVRLRDIAKLREELDAEQSELIVQLALDEAITYHEIADAAGFSISGGAHLVRRYALRAGIPPRTGGPRRKATT